MILLSHENTKLALAPKYPALLLGLLRGLNKSLLAARNWFYQDITCDKPEWIHYSNRAWNRNSAFIMSQFELAHENVTSGRVHD